MADVIADTHAMELAIVGDFDVQPLHNVNPGPTESVRLHIQPELWTIPFQGKLCYHARSWEAFEEAAGKLISPIWV